MQPIENFQTNDNLQEILKINKKKQEKEQESDLKLNSPNQVPKKKQMETLLLKQRKFLIIIYIGKIIKDF